jgi:biopolymer transport protein TolR
MPSVVSRGRGRRTISEINMVPFIDVMLVLLIIFMVTAPLIAPSMIHLPSVGKAPLQPPKVAQIIIDKSEQLQFKTDEKTSSVSAKQAAVLARQWQAQQPPDSAVVISAEKGIPYDTVVKVMDELQKAGVKRVGLSVQLLP